MNRRGPMDDADTPLTDADLHALRALAPPTAAPTAVDRTRRALRAEVLRQAALPRWPWPRALGELYFRVEPALAAGIVLTFLAWTGSTVVMLLQ
jgi:hypothetical protein